MRHAILALTLALPLSASVFGCAASTADDDVASTSSSLTTLSPAELAATKAKVRAIANANMTRTDNVEAVRAQLDPLVAKLAAHFGDRPVSAKLPLVEGAWRQLWTDFPYPMAPFLTMDSTQVYQVVTSDGYYYNLGDNRAFGLFGLTGVLRGAYVANGNKLNIQFTNSGFRFGRLAKGEDLFALATGLESGDRSYLSLPGGGKAPNGPVGISGTLETLYVDADLRIERGTQNDFSDGNVTRPGVGPKFFILDRVSTPAK